MTIQTPAPTRSATQTRAVKSSYLAALMIMGASVLALPTSPSHAEGLGDLFGNDQSSGQSKFLPVDEAFQVSSSTKAVTAGTRLAINFDITPGHYVYKDRIKLTLPAGVTATPFNFSQTPHSIDDPQFGRVPVFDQANMVATTTLSSSGGKRIDNAALTIGWQGCAKAGLCYPPENINTTVSIAATPAASTAPTSNSNNKADAAKATAPKAASETTSKTAPAPTANSASPTRKNDNAAAPAASTAANDSAAANRQQSSNTANASASGISAAADSETTAAAQNQDSTVPTDDEMAEQTETEDQVADSTMLDPNADPNTTSMAATNISSADTANNNVALDSSDSAALVDQDPFGLASHPWLALALLFLAGLGLALTPCVLPMLPIVANIVARQQNPTAKKGIILTTSYAVGVAIAYGLLGALIAVFGESLGIIGWLQNPIILISFAIVFVLLALYMLGLFNIRLPRAISSKMQGLSQAGDSKLGSAGGSLIAGFLSALVVSPCVSAPLFGALLAVSTIGNPLLGFAALFMLGFGLSAPLILIGATQGKIMPKAGLWMDWVKQGFALLLFAVALLLIERVFVSPVMLLVWAVWFMVVATWAWHWAGRGRMLTQALGLIAGIWAACLVVGAALGNDDSLHPLASLSAAPMLAASSDGQSANGNHTTDQYITTLAQLDAITAANPNVLVDLTADWCVECRIMDKNLFHNRPAQMQNWQLVRLDITDTTPDSKAILARYQLFGPPALLYYQNGQLVTQQVGEIGREQFEQTLTQLNQ